MNINYMLLYHVVKRFFSEFPKKTSWADIAEAIYGDLDDQNARGRETAQHLSVETWSKTEGLITVRQGNGCQQSGDCVAILHLCLRTFAL